MICTMPQTVVRGLGHHNYQGNHSHNGHVVHSNFPSNGISGFNGHHNHNVCNNNHNHVHNGHTNHNGLVQSGHSSIFPQNGHVKNNGHIGANGHAKAYMNGQALKPEDRQSTLSRYCTSDRRRNASNYHAIRRMCRERGCLYEDPDFSAGPKALYHNKKPPINPIVWMRPHEICQRPRFINDNNEEGNRKFTVESGELGDQWLLAAVASLALTPKFLDRVVPPDQGFDITHSYCGAFRFRFWHFGEWKDVVIDDKLPTHKGRLIYLHCSNNSEFWAALLEKAYAKLYGCYEQLQQGSTTRALQDLTGGIVQSFGLSHQDRFLTFQVLNSAVPRSSLLIATITQEKENKRQLRLRNGLITQHAYSVTGLARVRGVNGEVPLVRLRNPWAKGEWTGPWSERSWEWDGLSNRDKELLSIRVTNEGEFWMSFEDFSRHFTQLDLVHIGPDDWMMEGALHSKQPWRAVLARRRWRAGYNAGGGPSYIETTAMNPQFHVQIPRTSSNKCHVVVSITQYYETNVIEAKKKRPLYAIGFAVYEVPHSMQRLSPHFVAEQPLDVTNHSIAREVVTFFTLPPGDYIVVPQTNMPNLDGKFLLRIFTDEQSNIWEVNEDNMIIRNIASEFMDESNSPLSGDGKSILNKLLMKYPPEIDASQLQKILKSHWKLYLSEKPSLELCKSLIMLRDFNISGKISLMDIPVLMHMLQYWRLAFQKFERSHNCGKTLSYHLRALLWEAGCTVSNKVLECLVLRFAKNRILTAENYIMALVRLHLSHERYHNLDTKMKMNPISLEEMILMTIYS
ncbi:calpain-9-like isoform X2 [Diorhabda sublineata]|uniref:calpain-9-like isoform X2 n=1 Tax=Diorhabda sublineata TaxID=1163346 RepID=UPI0024E0755C|nr:calpain-9-like isoform X2 [Diorhabda sublineata]